MPLTHLLRLCFSQCLLIFLLCDAVAVWVFPSVCQAVPPLAVAFARLHVCHEVWPLLTEVLAGRAAVWHGGQLRMGCRSGGKLINFFHEFFRMWEQHSLSMFKPPALERWSKTQQAAGAHTVDFRLWEQHILQPPGCLRVQYSP